MVVSRALRFLRSRLTATAFVLLLATAEIIYGALSTVDQHALRDWASTNVSNLHTHPVGALLLSAFIPSENPPAWLLLAGVGLFGAEGLLGWWRSLLLVATAHVLGTLVSEGVVGWQVEHGVLARAALIQDDVGCSFVVVSALTLVLLYGWLRSGPAGLRVARSATGLAGLVALRGDLLVGLSHLDVTAVGHAVSMGIAAVIGGGLLLGRALSRKRGLSRAADYTADAPRIAP